MLLHPLSDATGLGVQGLSDIAANLDQERRELLAELLVNYIGW
ncbi:hypothetical protein ACNQR7_31630 [Mycolicibacterium senegalense]